jgi:hypothetical protein
MFVGWESGDYADQYRQHKLFSPELFLQHLFYTAPFLFSPQTALLFFGSCVYLSSARNACGIFKAMQICCCKTGKKISR